MKWCATVRIIFNCTISPKTKYMESIRIYALNLLYTRGACIREFVDDYTENHRNLSNKPFLRMNQLQTTGYMRICIIRLYPDSVKFIESYPVSIKHFISE